MRQISLKGLFTPQAIASALETLPPLKTTVIDLAFPAAANHQMPMIGISDIKRVIGTIPFVKRDGTTYKLDSQSMDVHLFAPLPLMPSVDVSAAELNNLSALTGTAKTEWVNGKIDELRQIVRKTTEAMASVVLTTGKLSWPTKLSGGGVSTFEVVYGEPLTYTPSKLWSAADAKITSIYDTLSDMDEKLQEAGYGGKVEFMAGREAFGQVIIIAQGWAAAGGVSPFEVKLEEGMVTIGGYKIHRMAERYENPVDSSQVYKLEPKTLIAYVKDSSNAKIFYCAIDSISANNQATPFHIHTEEKGDTAITLTAQAKPVPARNPKTICKAVVVS